MVNNSIQSKSSKDSHARSTFLDNDTVLSMEAARYGQNLSDNISASTEVRPDSTKDDNNDVTKETFSATNDNNDDVTMDTLSSYLFQLFSITESPSDHLFTKERNNDTTVTNQSTSNLNQTLTKPEKQDVHFLEDYLSDFMLNTAMQKTDLRVHLFQTSDTLFPNWPRFQNGNPFTDVRIHAFYDNVTYEYLWQIYTDPTEGLKNCPLFKGTYRQFRLDSGNGLMLVFLRNALHFLQDKAGLILLGYISNYSTACDDLLKTTAALLKQSLSIFYAPSAPVLPCPRNLFTDYDTDSFNRPHTVAELLVSVTYHAKFTMNLRRCELDLRQSLDFESDHHIHKIYEKVTVELLLVITALLIVPTILYSFTKVTKWITVYVSQLEERNSALAEKTAELDREKGRTEKLLYEVIQRSCTVLGAKPQNEESF